MSKPTLKLGISPCPNDTYIFHHLLQYGHGDFELDVEFHDIDDLNRLCSEDYFDVAKVSCALLADVSDRYGLLRSGGALGRGCGPLLVANESRTLQAGDCVLSPGSRTTAQLLLQRYAQVPVTVRSVLFSEIIPQLRQGQGDLGLLIHESRFTYRDYGLCLVEDLGSWWESLTGVPIPLGGLVARRSLPGAIVRSLQQAVVESVRQAHRKPQETIGFCARYAQEMAPDVMAQHIALYVNDYSLDIGTEGKKALSFLLYGDHEAPAVYLWEYS
ncbi:1,4-dihydroxy-6-naphthoate synthase [Desulfurispira natronophila]|uniref:1,4-dihydroxy-6-naphtoate synthase n=1 Tax=Desulfurispira natronophila TaxID=682562 RepID=A0A7W8DH75_9BACT|nr:1,4-dihydroxy-6-naphthoate synthase [Desulfurispira natronophila]MBB5022097.1 1,4-dihydroxy-6-naphthoate synthase [Desulfurispira natronophila]